MCDHNYETRVMGLEDREDYKLKVPFTVRQIKDSHNKHDSELFPLTMLSRARYGNSVLNLILNVVNNHIFELRN